MPAIKGKNFRWDQPIQPIGFLIEFAKGERFCPRWKGKGSTMDQWTKGREGTTLQHAGRVSFFFFNKRVSGCQANSVCGVSPKLPNRKTSDINFSQGVGFPTLRIPFYEKEKRLERIFTVNSSFEYRRRDRRVRWSFDINKGDVRSTVSVAWDKDGSLFSAVLQHVRHENMLLSLERRYKQISTEFSAKETK